MGKGDRKTKKGKTFMGSYGKRRPRKTNRTAFLSRQETPASSEKEVLKTTKADAPKAEKKTETKTSAAKKAAPKKSTKADSEK